MKNLDLFSRRILITSLSIAVILLSGSLFLFSIHGISRAEAGTYSFEKNFASGIKTFKSFQAPGQVTQDSTEVEDIHAIYAFGIGIREGTLYFGILYSNNTIGLHKAPADGPDVLEW